MACIMTLIGGPGAADALPDIAAAITTTLGLRAEPDWLAPGAACDVALGGIAPDTAERAARDTIGDVRDRRYRSAV